MWHRIEIGSPDERGPIAAEQRLWARLTLTKGTVSSIICNRVIRDVDRPNREILARQQRGRSPVFINPTKEAYGYGYTNCAHPPGQGRGGQENLQRDAA